MKPANCIVLAASNLTYADAEAAGLDHGGHVRTFRLFRLLARDKLKNGSTSSSLDDREINRTCGAMAVGILPAWPRQGGAKHHPSSAKAEARWPDGLGVCTCRARRNLHIQELRRLRGLRQIVGWMGAGCSADGPHLGYARYVGYAILANSGAVPVGRTTRPCPQ
jgi:hypothetical protein